MEEAAPLLGGSPTTTKRRARWQAAAAVATIGAVALSRGSRTATRVDALDALPPSTENLIQPARGPKPLQMGHFGKWTVMASTRKRMDETADAYGGG